MSSKKYGITLILQLFYILKELCKYLTGRRWEKVEERTVSRLFFSCRLTRPLIAAGVRRKLGNGTIFISGGAALDPAIAEGFAKLGVTLYQGYGITETSPVIAAESPNGVQPGTVARVLDGIEVRIDVPDDEQIGEILVKGPNVMQGYFKDPPATAEAIVTVGIVPATWGVWTPGDSCRSPDG